MKIYWNPVEDDVHADTIEVYEEGILIGIADVSNHSGMPDSIGGVAPDAVREMAQDYFDITASEAAYEVEYVDMREHENPHLDQ